MGWPDQQTDPRRPDLADYPGEVVCDACDRRGAYRRSTLMTLFGADASLPDVLASLARCPRAVDGVEPVRRSLSRPCAGWRRRAMKAGARRGGFVSLSAPGDLEMAGRGGARRAHCHDFKGVDVSRSRREAGGAKSDDL